MYFYVTVLLAVIDFARFQHASLIHASKFEIQIRNTSMNGGMLLFYKSGIKISSNLSHIYQVMSLRESTVNKMRKWANLSSIKVYDVSILIN